jgi:tripartite ATP-independent transporter DctP family solute receptor
LKIDDYFKEIFKLKKEEFIMFNKWFKIGLVILILVLMMMITLGTQAEEKAKVTLTIATIYPPAQPASKAVEKAKELIEEKSNGEIEIIHYNSAQLGNNPELAQGVSTGSVDMNAQSLSYFEDQFPEVEIDSFFYLYRDWGHMQRVWESEVGQWFNDKLIEKAGVRILDTWPYGSRIITTKNKPIYSPDDLIGLKLRCPPAKAWVDMVSSFGCSAAPVAFDELYLALSQGIVDGQENPISVVMASKFNEVQNYMSLTYHKKNTIYVLINEKKWKSLTEEQQKIVSDSFIEARNTMFEEIEKQDKEGLETFKAGGGIVIENPDREAFQAKVAEVYEMDAYKHLVDLYNKIQAVK